MKMRCLARLTLALLAWAGVPAASGGERWSNEQAGAWSRRTGWLVGCNFTPNTAIKEQKIGAYNWGFVAGKTQTIFPWDSWEKTYTAEPPVWFHDILRPDGTPFDAKEVAFIRHVTGRTK